jgi:hypothetical protein
MRILIDTNIFIQRENFHVLPENLKELLKILNILRVDILVHPKSIEEIKKDQNLERRNVTISKIQIYRLLEVPPYPDEDKNFLSMVGQATSMNEYIDNVLLYAVFRDAVDFLVSEDKGILNKGLKTNLKDRVLSIEEALIIFEKDFPKEKVRHPPALRDEYVYNLKLDDPFFDSLKVEYQNFENWFKKISKEGRRCWVHLDNGTIGALLIYKPENELISSVPPLPVKRRLKLCTFKVISIGYKIGELFIKLSVEYCVKNNVDEIYLTHYTKKDDPFVNLIVQYGFSKTASINMQDVYIKRLIPDKAVDQQLAPIELSRIYYPSFYDGVIVNKFIVPIRPKYHNRLFIDYYGRQAFMSEFIGKFIIEGNTISKAYLCHSQTRKLSKGDLLLFYRSQDKKELTSVGIVENVYYGLRDADKVLRLVGKRTVYHPQEIEEMVKKPTLVILFRHHFHFPNPIKLDMLKKMNIFENVPQSIMKIKHNKYLQIKVEGKLDECYTFN